MAKKIRVDGKFIGYEGRGSKQKAQKAVKLLNMGGGSFKFGFFRTKGGRYYLEGKKRGKK